MSSASVRYLRVMYFDNENYGVQLTELDGCETASLCYNLLHFVFNQKNEGVIANAEN